MPGTSSKSQSLKGEISSAAQGETAQQQTLWRDDNPKPQEIRGDKVRSGGRVGDEETLQKVRRRGGKKLREENRLYQRKEADRELDLTINRLKSRLVLRQKS